MASINLHEDRAIIYGMWNESLRCPDQGPKGRVRDLVSTMMAFAVERRSLDGATLRVAPLGTAGKIIICDRPAPEGKVTDA
jgi:hypothetical protein